MYCIYNTRYTCPTKWRKGCHDACPITAQAIADTQRIYAKMAENTLHNPPDPNENDSRFNKPMGGGNP